MYSQHLYELCFLMPLVLILSSLPKHLTVLFLVWKVPAVFGWKTICFLGAHTSIQCELPGDWLPSCQGGCNMPARDVLFVIRFLLGLYTLPFRLHTSWMFSRVIKHFLYVIFNSVNKSLLNGCMITYLSNPPWLDNYVIASVLMINNSWQTPS